MSRSTFPQKIDSFTELFDLPADKVAAALELQKLKQKTTLNNDEQNKISALSAQLQDYMITPETMNKLQDAIVEIETFFDGNVRQYIPSKQKEWDTCYRFTTFYVAFEFYVNNRISVPADMAWGNNW